MRDTTKYGFSIKLLDINASTEWLYEIIVADTGQRRLLSVLKSSHPKETEVFKLVNTYVKSRLLINNGQLPENDAPFQDWHLYPAHS